MDRTVTRREFVSRFMQDAGMTYHQACRAYTCLCRTIEDAVVCGLKVSVGQVGAIVPVWRKPREVKKHFDRGPGGTITKTRKTYILDGRYTYKFVVYKRFRETHQLRWQADLTGVDSE